MEGLEALVAEDIQRVERLASAFWPGPMTLIFRASSACPSLLVSESGRIGVRVPDHDELRGVIRALEAPLASTSANISGQKPFLTSEDLSRGMPGVDLVYPGRARGRRASTALDLSSGIPNILRKGGLSMASIESALEEEVGLTDDLPLNVLLICTGNTCRSTMAEWLMRARLPEDIRHRVDVRSAGTHAPEGSGLSPDVGLVLEEIGVDAQGFRCHELTREHIVWADVILGMEEQHVRAARNLGGGEKARLYGGSGYGAIQDPYGGPLDGYRETRDFLAQILDESWIPYIARKFKRTP
jgi:protein-tyrosine-phosphatase